MTRRVSPDLALDEESEAKRTRSDVPLHEVQNIGSGVSGPRGCTIYEGFTVRDRSYGQRNVVILLDGRIVKLLLPYRSVHEGEIASFVVQIFYTKSDMELYKPPDKRSFNEGDWQWLPHHTQPHNELLLTTSMESITIYQIASLTNVHKHVADITAPPATELYYSRVFHSKARAVWTAELEPAVDAYRLMMVRSTGYTKDDPILLDDEADPPTWIDNANVNGASFMERAHQNLNESRWASQRVTATYGNRDALEAAKIDVLGLCTHQDRPAYDRTARRKYYERCTVMGNVHSVGDDVLLKLVESNFPPPYIARITRIYKLVHVGRSAGSDANDWCVDLFWMWTLSQTFLNGIPADRVASRELVFSANLVEERVPQGAILRGVTVRPLSDIEDLDAYVRADKEGHWWHRSMVYDPAQASLQCRKWIHRAPIDLLSARSRIILDAHHEERLAALAREVRLLGDSLRVEESVGYRKTFYGSCELIGKQFAIGDLVLLLVDSDCQVLKRDRMRQKGAHLSDVRECKGDDEPFWLGKILEIYEGRWVDAATKSLRIEQLVNIEYFSRLSDIKRSPPQPSPDWQREVCVTTARGVHPLTERTEPYVTSPDFLPPVMSHATVRLVSLIPMRHWATYLRDATHFICRYHYNTDAEIFTELTEDIASPSLPRGSAHVTPRKTLRVLDLYAGAGGLSVGLESVGLDVQWGVECNSHAAATFRSAHPKAILYQQPIQAFLKALKEPEGCQFYPRPRQVDVIVGGPPCQTFSTQNATASTTTPAVNLVGHFYEVVAALEPTYVIMENVPGIVRDDMVVIAEALRHLHMLGYQWRVGVLNAACYGAAQLRSRLFIVGAKYTVPLPVWPTPTHAIRPIQAFCGVPRDTQTSLRDGLVLRSIGAPVRSTTLRDVIEDLEELDGQEPQESYKSDDPRETTGVAARLRDQYFPAQHATLISQSENIIRRWHQSSKKHRLKYDEPSPTVTSRQDHMIHPTQERTLTVRELARIQGFPDCIRFAGNPEHLVKQIGNAVPTALGEALGRMLNESAACAESHQADYQPLPSSVDCFVELGEVPTQEEVLTEWVAPPGAAKISQNDVHSEPAADVLVTESNLSVLPCAVEIEIAPVDLAVEIIVIDD